MINLVTAYYFSINIFTVYQMRQIKDEIFLNNGSPIRSNRQFKSRFATANHADYLFSRNEETGNCSHDRAGVIQWAKYAKFKLILIVTINTVE
jgi:hypothetical protein